MTNLEAKKRDLERKLAELERALSQAARADPVERALAEAARRLQSARVSPVKQAAANDCYKRGFDAAPKVKAVPYDRKEGDPKSGYPFPLGITSFCGVTRIYPLSTLTQTMQM